MTEPPELSNSYRSLVVMGSVSVVALMLWPVFKDPPRDSFPHSDFPMFAHYRPTEIQLTHTLGVDVSDSRTPLSPHIAAGNGEVLQAMGIIAAAVHEGRADALCKEIGGRLQNRSPGEYQTIEVVTSHFDTLRYFDGDKEPIARQVHARCEIDNQSP